MEAYPLVLVGTWCARLVVDVYDAYVFVLSDALNVRLGLASSTSRNSDILNQRWARAWKGWLAHEAAALAQAAKGCR